MNNPYLLKGLSLTPKILGDLIWKLPEASFDARPDSDRFTLREALAHLADWEPIFAERMGQTLSIPHYVIVPYDESQFAIDRNYATSDVQEQLERFSKGRADNLAFLQARSKEEWSTIAGHPERGPMTLEDQASLMLGHDLYHIEQFTAGLRPI